VANFDFNQVTTDEQRHLKSLRDRLLEGVEVVSPEQSSLYFTEDDQRWAETQTGEDSPTGQDRILINDRKFQESGAQDYHDEMVFGESLHRLKQVDPERYDRIYNTAQQSEPYMNWARASYDRSREQYGEERSFEDWHKHSRFDQVIGGFLLSESQNLPSMQGWERGSLPLGPELRGELELLERDLNAQPQGFDFSQTSADIEVDPRSTLGQSIDTFKTLAAGVGQFGMFVSKGMWDSADSASRVSDTVANGLAEMGTPEWLNPFRFTTEAFRILDEGLDIGDMHFEGMGDVADRIGTAAEILPELFPSFARLGVKSEEAEEAWDALWSEEHRLDLMAKVVTDPEAWGAFIGNALPSLFLAWRSGGSLPFIGWLEALDAAENAREYEDITGEKISSEQFVTSVGVAGAVNAFLEKAGLDSVLGKFARGGRFNWLTGFVTGMAGEGGTEAMQEITQNLAGLGYDEELQDQALEAINEGKWEPFLDKMNNNILPAIMGGGGLGGPIGSLNAHVSTMAERGDQQRADEAERRAAGKPSLLGDFGRTKITPEEAKEMDLKEVEVTQELLEKVGRGDPLTIDEQYTLTNQGLGRFTGEAGNERVTMLNPGRERLIELRGEEAAPVEAEVTEPGGPDLLSVWRGDLTEMQTRRGELLDLPGELNAEQQGELDTLNDRINEREGDISELQQVLEEVPASRFHMEEVTPDVVVEPEPVSETFVAETHKPRAQREGRRSIRERIKRAVARTDTQPTEAQIEAGNYRKGHLRVQAVPISVENPKGSTRKGTDRQGRKWSRRLKDNYGYIQGTVGKDKDHLDTFIGDYPESDTVVVINQKKDATKELDEGNFDEHKVMIGYPNVDAAIQGYNRNYDDGGALKGTAVQMSMAEFKTWLAEADTTKIAESNRETLYRGETALTEGGPSYSGSRAVAKQFAGGEPIIERTIKKSDIYEATDVAASDQEAVDAVIEKARAKGQKAVRLSEGVAAAPSVLVFDHTALRDDQVFPAKQRAKRRTNDGKGMSVDALQRAVQPFYSFFRSAPPVRVVEAVEDLPLQLQQQLKSTGDEGLTNGVYTQDALTDTVYLIANNTSNKAEGIETMVHEIIGHYGLHQIVPPHLFNATMDKIAKSFPKEVREAAVVQGLDFTDTAERRIAAEEFIAYTAQKILRKQKVSVKARQYVDDLVRAIQNMFRQAFGQDVVFTNGQVMSMIAQASDYVQSPAGYVRDKQRGYRRHMGNPVFYSQMFKILNDEKARNMSPQGWMQLISGHMKANRIKEEEVQWSGILEFLEDATWGDVVAMIKNIDQELVSSEVWDSHRRLENASVMYEGAKSRDRDTQRSDDEAAKSDSTYTLNKASDEQAAAITEWEALKEQTPKKIPKEAILRFIQVNGVDIQITQPGQEVDLSHLSEENPDESESEETEDDMYEDYDRFKEDSNFDTYETDALKEVHEEHDWDPDLEADPDIPEEANMDLEELNSALGAWDGATEEDMEEQARDQATESFDQDYYEEFKSEWEENHMRLTWYAEDWTITRMGGEFYAYESESGHEIGAWSSFDDVVREVEEQTSGDREPGEGKWSDYTLPGGEDYEEWLLRWENPDETLFTAPGHWGGSSNMIVHVRFDVRRDEDGEEAIFIDEIQSDWHQAIRDRGYKNSDVADDALAERRKLWGEYMNEDRMTFETIMMDWELSPEEAEQISIDERYRSDVIEMLGAYVRLGKARENTLERNIKEAKAAQLRQVMTNHGYRSNRTETENRTAESVLEDAGEPQRWDGTSLEAMTEEAEKAVPTLTLEDVDPDVVNVTWAGWLEQLENMDIDDDRAGGGANDGSRMRMALLWQGMADDVYAKLRGQGFGDPRPKPDNFDELRSRSAGLLLEYGEQRNRYQGARDGMAAAPFEKTWQLLVMKAIIKEAISRGHNKVFMAPGDIHGMPTRWGGAVSVNAVQWSQQTRKVKVPAKKPKVGGWKFSVQKPQKIKDEELQEREVEAEGVEVTSVTWVTDEGEAPTGQDQRGVPQFVTLAKLHEIVGSDVAQQIKKDLKAGEGGGRVNATDVGRTRISMAKSDSKHMSGSRAVYNVITPNLINAKFLKKYKTSMRLGGKVFGNKYDPQRSRYRDTSDLPEVEKMEAEYGVKGGVEDVPLESAYDTWGVKVMGAPEIERFVASYKLKEAAEAKGDWYAVYTDEGEIIEGSIAHGQEGSYNWLAEARAREARQYFEAWEIEITDELRAGAEGGFPLFHRKTAQYNRDGPFQIINTRTGAKVGKPYQGKNAIKRVRNRVDKLDNEYGGYVHSIRDVSTGGPRYSKKAKPGGRRTGDVGLDQALDWAELHIGPPKMRSLERLQDQFNKVVNIEGKLRKAEQLMVDQFAGIKWAIHEHHGRHLSAEESGYKQAHFTTSGDSQMYAFLMHGLPEWQDGITQIKEGTKGLLEILEPIINNLDEWGYWMAARRAKRLMEEDREHLFTEEKIAELLKLGGDPETGVEAMFAEFQTVADDYAAWNSGFLDWAQEAGVINAETRPLWENADYVPFYRVKSDELGGSFDTRTSSGTAGIANQLNPIKRLKGGKERIGDITENILINMTHMASTAMKNQAVRQTIKNLEGSGLMEPVKGAAFMKLATISMEDLKKKLKAAGVSVEAMPTDALNAMQKMWTIGAPTGGDIISVMENGKKKYYKVNETTLFRSLTAINQQKFNSVMGRMLMFPFRGSKRLLTSMITLAPGFMVANWFRDIAMAFVNSRHATWNKPRFDRSVTGALKALTQSKEMVSMMAAGGAFYSGYINAMDPGATTKSLKRAMRKSGVRHRVIDAPWKLFHLYNDLGAAAENANRIGHGYIPAVKAGATTAEAVWEAKDLMNFAKHGDAMAMQFLVQTTPFLNARIQGLVRWGQRLVEAPGATLAKSMMYTLAVMAVYLGNKDDDRYKELPDEEKDMYIHFWINGHHWRLPKAFEVGSIFGTVPERMFEWMYSKEDDRTRHALDRMKFVIDQVFMVNINPLHMVQLIKPFYEAGTNWNSFFRGPIIPEYMQDIAEAKPDMVYRPTTSPLARELATRMPRFAPHTLRNPMLLEHIMRGYTGTLGSYLMLMTDDLIRKNFDYPPRPALRWDQTPMAARFYRGDDPLRRTGYENMMYEIRGAARGIARTISQMEQVGRQEEIEAFRNSPSEYHARYTNFQIEQASKTMDAPYNAIRRARNRMNQIWIDKDMSPEAKLMEINELQQQINERTQEAYERRPGSSTVDYEPIASAESVLTVPAIALLEDLDGRDQPGTTAFLRENGLIETAELVAGLPIRPNKDLVNLLKDTPQ
jgi:hypothetical protein